jgi:hypothetical protein
MTIRPLNHREYPQRRVQVVLRGNINRRFLRLRSTYRMRALVGEACGLGGIDETFHSALCLLAISSASGGSQRDQHHGHSGAFSETADNKGRSRPP